MIAAMLLAILICIIGSAFYSGIETGVISIHRARLNQRAREGKKSAIILKTYTDDPDRLLGTTLVGTNICNIASSVLAASLFTSLLPRGGEVVSTFVMSVVLLIFGEYLPKSWFQSSPIRRSSRFVRSLQVSHIMLWPISKIVTAFARLVTIGMGKADANRASMITREELKLLALESEHQGILKPRERQMIHSVFELSTRPARAIMTPREKMIVVQHTESLGTAFAMASEKGLSRLPVYNQEKDEFVGVINIFDVLGSEDLRSTAPVTRFMRAPLFIDESMPIDDIFPRLRFRHQPMSLVRSKAGKVIGLITTEDIIEEVVGDIES
jgi:CBS domain containing-hemolysin-like protein